MHFKFVRKLFLIDSRYSVLDQNLHNGRLYNYVIIIWVEWICETVDPAWKLMVFLCILGWPFCNRQRCISSCCCLSMK